MDGENRTIFFGENEDSLEIQRQSVRERAAEFWEWRPRWRVSGGFKNGEVEWVGVKGTADSR